MGEFTATQNVVYSCKMVALERDTNIYIKEDRTTARLTLTQQSFEFDFLLYTICLKSYDKDYIWNNDLDI